MGIAIFIICVYGAMIAGTGYSVTNNDLFAVVAVMFFVCAMLAVAVSNKEKS